MFNLGEKMDVNKAINLSPVVLAFVGDAVYSLYVREKLTFSSDCKTGELNVRTVSVVKASAQAEYVKKIIEFFNENELSVFKRARNARKNNRAKSASVSEYNYSSGFEAVLGYLYLIGDVERLNYLLNKGN